MAPPLRVCFLALHFAPMIGGAESRAEKQARQMQALGHQVIVLTARHQRRWPRQERREGLPVVRVGGVYKRDGTLRIGRLGIWPVNIGVLWTLWTQRHHYDVIHAAQVSPLAAMATLLGTWTGKPVIISIASTEPSPEQRARIEHDGRLMADTLTETSFLAIDPARWANDSHLTHHTALGGALLFKFVRTSHATFQTLSRRSRAELVAHGFHPERIVYISGSVDTERFCPAAQHRPRPAQAERLIVCVARLEYQKGIDVLLHAWGRMMRAPAEWRANLIPQLQLVGDGALRSQLERLAAELGIADSVQFLGRRTDVLDLLQHAWGFVLPSRWEGMSNALLEAMACGLPCIATRVSGSEDVINDGVDGLLVESEQPEELAVALRRVIEDAALASRLGQEGRATVTREYQLVHVVEQCVALYRDLLAKGTPALESATKGNGADG